MGVAQGDSTPPINKQAALYSIKLLARRLAPGRREEFVKVGMTKAADCFYSNLGFPVWILSHDSPKLQDKFLVYRDLHPYFTLSALGFSHRVSLTLEQEPSPSCEFQQLAVHDRTLQRAWTSHDPSPPLTATPGVTTCGRGEDQVLCRQDNHGSSSTVEKHLSKHIGAQGCLCLDKYMKKNYLYTKWITVDLIAMNIIILTQVNLL